MVKSSHVVHGVMVELRHVVNGVVYDEKHEVAEGECIVIRFAHVAGKPRMSLKV